LAKLPIKELTNEQYKKSLIESLNRGNLQKVTFVDGNGKEKKLFISPSITLGSLNVYDLNKQRVPTETLVEKHFIGKELAADLKERVTQKKTQTQTPIQAHEQRVKAAQKQKNEKSAQKQTRKQKIK